MDGVSPGRPRQAHECSCVALQVRFWVPEEEEAQVRGAVGTGCGPRQPPTRPRQAVMGGWEGEAVLRKEWEDASLLLRGSTEGQLPRRGDPNNFRQHCRFGYQAASTKKQQIECVGRRQGGLQQEVEF